MSVVNKMLRDLENRQGPQKTTANYIPPTKPTSLLVGISLAIFVGFFALLYSFVSLKENTPRPTQQGPTTNFKPEKGDQLAQEGAPHAIGQAPHAIGQAPQVVGQAPHAIGQAPQVVGQAPHAIGQATQAIGQTPQVIRYAPQNNNHSSVMLQKANPLMNMNQYDIDETARDFNVKASDGVKSRLSSLRAKAHLASEQGKDEDVISFLQQILAVDATEIRTRKQLAAMLFSKSKLDEAQSILNEGLQLTPEDSSLRLMLSRIHFKTGDNYQAFNILIQHPFNQSANDELLSFRAALAEKIGEYEIAQQDYQLLVQRNPLEAKWWLGLGVAQDKQHLIQQAIDSYLQAQQLKQLPAQVEVFVEQRIQLLERRS